MNGAVGKSVAGPTGQTKAVARQRTYSTEDIDRGLSAVAFFGGNSRKAHSVLKAQGLEIPRSTLRDWATKTRTERYAELRASVLPEIHAAAAEKHRALAERAMEVEAKAIDRVEEELPNLPARDVSTAARNLAVEAGIHRQRGGELVGMFPNAPIVQVNIGEQMRGLAARGGRFFDNDGNPIDLEEAIRRAQNPPSAIEGTATDLTAEDTHD